MYWLLSARTGFQVQQRCHQAYPSGRKPPVVKRQKLDDDADSFIADIMR